MKRLAAISTLLLLVIGIASPPATAQTLTTPEGETIVCVVFHRTATSPEGGVKAEDVVQLIRIGMLSLKVVPCPRPEPESSLPTTAVEESDQLTAHIGWLVHLKASDAAIIAVDDAFLPCASFACYGRWARKVVGWATGEQRWLASAKPQKCYRPEYDAWKRVVNTRADMANALLRSNRTGADRDHNAFKAAARRADAALKAQLRMMRESPHPCGVA